MKEQINKTTAATSVRAIEKEGLTNDPCYFIREAYAARRVKNATYSLRAFARDLGVSHPLLSQVLNGRRPLTLKQAHKISALLSVVSTRRKIIPRKRFVLVTR